MKFPEPVAKSFEMDAGGERDMNMWKIRASRVRDFAGLLGLRADGSSSSGLPQAIREKAVLKLISDTIQDHEIVLTLPSLDMGLNEAKDLNPLPVVGEHRDPSLPRSNEESRPTMTASVLTGATEGVANSELKAAQNIDKLTSWTKSTLGYASDAVKKNISRSFASLVDARVRAWTLLLLRHSLSSGDNESRAKLMRMLSSSIKILDAATDYKTLELPDSVASQCKEGEVILPLLFEVVLNVSVQEKEERVTLRAPGTISGTNSCLAFIRFIECTRLTISFLANFDASIHNPGITRLEVRLTSANLLGSMVEQARMVVLRTVATATKTEVPLAATDSGYQATAGDALELTSSSSHGVPQTGSNFSTFGSALNLTSDQTSSHNSSGPRIQKARASALKLTSVLHHKSDVDSANAGVRRNRSVKFDGFTQSTLPGSSVPPSPKKFKGANVNKLKSFKSFGRPHAPDGPGGPRNATFAEFDRPGGAWGRDGRMAYHPRPMQQGSDPFSEAPTPKGNATFDIGAPGLRSGSVALSNFGLQRSSGTGGMSLAKPAIPRTATALEMFVLKKSTSGGQALGLR
jgi:hypothetical protein